MTKTQLKKFIKDHFKPRSPYQRIFCRHSVLPFAEKLLKEVDNLYEEGYKQGRFDEKMDNLNK